MAVTPSGSLPSEEDNTFNILMGKEEHFVKDLWEQGCFIGISEVKYMIFFLYYLVGGRSLIVILSVSVYLDKEDLNFFFN